MGSAYPPAAPLRELCTSRSRRCQVSCRPAQVKWRGGGGILPSDCNTCYAPLRYQSVSIGRGQSVAVRCTLGSFSLKNTSHRCTRPLQPLASTPRQLASAPSASPQLRRDASRHALQPTLLAASTARPSNPQSPPCVFMDPATRQTRQALMGQVGPVQAMAAGSGAEVASGDRSTTFAVALRVSGHFSRAE